jgi:hypothetical protein
MAHFLWDLKIIFTSNASKTKAVGTLTEQANYCTFNVGT